MGKSLLIGLLTLLALAGCGGAGASKSESSLEPTPHWTADKCKAEDQGDTFGLCGDKNTVTFVCDAFVPDISSGDLNCTGPAATKDQSVGQVWCCYLPE